MLKQLMFFLLVLSLFCTNFVSAVGDDYYPALRQMPSVSYAGQKSSDSPTYVLNDRWEFWVDFLKMRGGFALVKLFTSLTNFSLLFMEHGTKSDTKNYETSFFLKNFSVIQEKILAIKNASPELQEELMMEFEWYFQKNLYANDNNEKLPEGGLAGCFVASKNKIPLMLMLIVEAVIDLARLCSTTQVQISEKKVFDRFFREYSGSWETKIGFEMPTTGILSVFIIEKCFEIACFSHTARKVFSSDARCKELTQRLVKNWDEVHNAYLNSSERIGSVDHYFANKKIDKLLNVENHLVVSGLGYLMLAVMVSQIAEAVYKTVIENKETYSRI